MAARSSDEPGVVPGPPGLPLFGNLPAMQRKGWLQSYMALWRRYGDTVRIRLGPVNAYLLIHPNAVEHVLVGRPDNFRKGLGYRKLQMLLGQGLLNSEGELWRHQRRLMQPHFTPRAVGQYSNTITAATEAMLAGWDQRQAPDQPLDIDFEMMRLAVSIISTTMFGFDLGAYSPETGRDLRFALSYIADRTVAVFDMPLFVPTPANRRFKRAIRAVNQLIDRIMEGGRQQSEPDGSLLSRLLPGADAHSRQVMIPTQVRDETLTIFFAGHETTARALSWSWYLLAQSPESEARLHAELRTVLNGRKPTLEDVPQLTYTRAVVEESMRLYPPVWAFARQAVVGDEIGGYRIPSRALIVLSPYITHRHPSFWTDPERFEPGRFTSQAAVRPQYAYFPFGGGPRVCLGMHFALLETQLVLATIAQRYRFELPPGQTADPVAAGTLFPRNGLSMTATRRA